MTGLTFILTGFQIGVINPTEQNRSLYAKIQFIYGYGSKVSIEYSENSISTKKTHPKYKILIY